MAGSQQNDQPADSISIKDLMQILVKQGENQSLILEQMKAQQELMKAILEPENDPDEAEIRVLMEDQKARTIAFLRDEPKVSIFIPRPSGTDPNKVKYHYVGINTFPIHIAYDEHVDVPREIYLILVRGGVIKPHKGDEGEAPPVDDRVKVALIIDGSDKATILSR